MSNSGRSFRGKPKCPLRCYNCDKPGHFSCECKEPPRQSQPPTHPPSKRRRRHRHKARVAAAEPAGDLEDCEFSLCTDTDDLVEKPDEWIIDSGASAHMTNDRNAFVSYTKLPVAQGVKLGDGQKVNAIGQGIVRVEMNHAKGNQTVTNLMKMLHVPDITCNLLSEDLV